MFKEKCYFSKYKKKEIKNILRELKKENRFTIGYRFLGVSGGFIFRVWAFEFYRYDEFSHKQFLACARFKVDVEEKEDGSLIKVKEITPISWGEIILILLLSTVLVWAFTAVRNMEFLSVITVALPIIAAFLALSWFIFYCGYRYGDRNKECIHKGEMFLKNRLELKETEK